MSYYTLMQDSEQTSKTVMTTTGSDGARSKSNRLSFKAPSGTKGGLLPVVPHYLNWQGNNIICCSGRVIGGSELSKCLGSLSLIVVPALVYFAAVMPAQLHHGMLTHVLIQCFLIIFSIS